MARPVRFQYAGAVYHVMARGDGGKMIFETDEDRQVFLGRLGQVCGSHGWKVHAWVLMGNHFHLLLETPQANLVSGMKWLLRTFSQGWNRSRLRRGHVFQGRYKSIPVNASDSDPYYFRVTADYIHLNPARAGLAGGDRGPLAAYRWSSLKSYARGRGPVWLEMDRVLNSFELATDGRGRRAYVDWLEARASENDGGIGADALAALRRGWYLGEESFRDRLLNLVETGMAAVQDRTRKSSMNLQRDHGEAEAERLVLEGAKVLGLPADIGELEGIRKGDERKMLLASLIRSRTGVGPDWIAKRLKMGHPGSVSRLNKAVADNREHSKKLRELEEML